MSKWFREYISVLSREFFALYGLAMGAVFASCWIFFRHLFPTLVDSYFGLPGLCLIFVGAFVLSRIVLIVCAYFVRRKGGLPEKAQVSKKVEAGQRSLANKYRWSIYGFILLLFSIQILSKCNYLPMHTTFILSSLAIFGFMAWTTVLSFQRRPELKLKSGSVAQKLSAASKYVLLVLLIIFIIEQIWIAVLLKRFP
jgi:hypothetical protein